MGYWGKVASVFQFGRGNFVKDVPFKEITLIMGKVGKAHALNPGRSDSKGLCFIYSMVWKLKVKIKHSELLQEKKVYFFNKVGTLIESSRNTLKHWQGFDHHPFKTAWKHYQAPNWPFLFIYKCFILLGVKKDDVGKNETYLVSSRKVPMVLNQFMSNFR